MNLRRALEWTTLACGLVAITGYAVAARDPLLGAAGVPGFVGAWALRGSPIGRRIPRIVVNGVLLAAIAHSAWRALGQGVHVEDVASLIVVLLGLKAFDRAGARDLSQILALSVFLVLASMLTRVTLEIGILVCAAAPLLVLGAMLERLCAGHEACDRSGRPAMMSRAGRRDLAWVAGLSIGAGVVIGAGVFVVIPRGIGENLFGDWRSAAMGTQTRFTSTVQLGRGGLISQSSTIVLYMEVLESGQPAGGPDMVYYLRGTVLDRYDPEARTWTRSRDGGTTRVVRPDASEEVLLAPPNTPAGLQQRITILNAAGPDTPIFTVMRPATVQFDRGMDLVIDADDQRVLARNVRGKIEYVVRSTSTPASRGPARGASFDSESLRGLSVDILRDAGVTPEQAEEDRSARTVAVRAIESYLRRTMGYTLDIAPAPPGRDPIEWFVFEHRQGHCEYFASAMTAMCRSVGINARVVAGYVAGEWNPGARHYVVRESNAHAWVEVQHAEGDWRVYDPTPPGDLRRLHRPAEGLAARVRQWFDAMSYAWNSTIVGFDEGTRDRLMRREAEGTSDWLMRLYDLWNQARRAGVRGMVRALAVAAGVFVGVSIAGIAAQVAAARGWRWLVGARTSRGSARAGRGALATLDRELRRARWGRPAWRPPLVHVRELRSSHPEPAAAAQRITDLYYAARFGGRDLTLEELGEQLRCVEEVRRWRRGRRSPASKQT